MEYITFVVLKKNFLKLIVNNAIWVLNDLLGCAEKFIQAV